MCVSPCLFSQKENFRYVLPEKKKLVSPTVAQTLEPAREEVATLIFIFFTTSLIVSGVIKKFYFRLSYFARKKNS